MTKIKKMILVAKKVAVSEEFVGNTWYIVYSQDVNEILQETKTFIMEFFIFMIFFSLLIFFAIFLFF